RLISIHLLEEKERKSLKALRIRKQINLNLIINVRTKWYACRWALMDADTTKSVKTVLTPPPRVAG
ncbi:MAG: hypothetical protein AAFR72_09410, partial [Pseudomonadota bacterium]